MVEIVVLMNKWKVPGHWQPVPAHMLQEAESKVFKGIWRSYHEKAIRLYHQNATRLSKSKKSYEYVLAYSRQDANRMLMYLQTAYPKGEFQLWRHYLPEKDA